MAVIRTIIGFICVAIASVVLVPICIALAVLKIIGLNRLSITLMHRVVYYGAQFIAFSVGCKMRSTDHENISALAESGKTGGFCFVCNHTGIFDIVLIFATLGLPFGFIAKKELIMVPMINMWILFLGGIFLDRKNPRKALKTINNGSEKIKKGHSMLIFPEGTRSRGRGLLPFKSGSFKMAVDANATIVPIAITGGYEVFEKTGLIQARTVYISFGKAIETSAISGEHKRQTVCNMAYNAIAEMLAKQGPNSDACQK
jgi:1-acyl-sn-glycerol-3-phosphate acyltransferase